MHDNYMQLKITCSESNCCYGKTHIHVFVYVCPTHLVCLIFHQYMWYILYVFSSLSTYIYTYNIYIYIQIASANVINKYIYIYYIQTVYVTSEIRRKELLYDFPAMIVII